MPVVYQPSYSYYAGERKSFSDKLQILIFESEKVFIYTFLPIFQDQIERENIIAEELTENYFVGTTNITLENSSDVKTIGMHNLFNRSTQGKRFFHFQNIVNITGYNFYKNTNNPNNIELDILELVGQVCIPMSVFTINDMDPNVDYGVIYRNNSYNVVNHSTFTKENYMGLLSLRNDDIFSFNTGFGNITDITNANINISPSVAYFFSNLTFSPSLVKSNNQFTFPGKLNAKVTGPTTATVGDILEYTITLMNSNFSDTFTSPSTVEVYPSSSAGIVSHRKVKLVNGVGKFKLDTSNLYAGETIEVKVGWKYITGDSKVSVTLS